MSQPVFILCPGQGAQTLGMGRAWRDASPAARALFDRADAQLAADPVWASHHTHPLSELCFNGPADAINRTDVSQPAIFVCSLASWAGLRDREPAAGGVRGLPLAGAAGLSLGEYTALVVAGAITFDDGLRLVTLRGRAMQDAAAAVPSGMLALIGADEPKAADLCSRAAGPDVLVVANLNAPGQVVISGHLTACARAEQLAPDLGLRATRLPVAGAFHSPLMAPAADRLREALARTPIALPHAPVLSNVTARPHAASPGSTPADTIRARLAEQLTSPVRWSDSLLAGLAPGGCLHGSALHELAPGKTLAGLMRRIERSATVTTHDDPAT